jgi:hypothetical protein
MDKKQFFILLTRPAYPMSKLSNKYSTKTGMISGAPEG